MILAPSRKLWTPWDDLTALFTGGKMQRNPANGKFKRNPANGKMRRNTDTNTSCCCTPVTECPCPSGFFQEWISITLLADLCTCFFSVDNEANFVYGRFTGSHSIELSSESTQGTCASFIDGDGHQQVKLVYGATVDVLLPFDVYSGNVDDPSETICGGAGVDYVGNDAFTSLFLKMIYRGDEGIWLAQADLLSATYGITGRCFRQVFGTDHDSCNIPEFTYSDKQCFDPFFGTPDPCSEWGDGSGFQCNQIAAEPGGFMQAAPNSPP